jgi:PBSX family phage terminase large subunit
MSAARSAVALGYLDLAATHVIGRKYRPVAVPTFRGAALEAQRITSHEFLTEGPAETGKTFADLYRLDSLARQTPRGTGVIIRKVHADLNSSVLQTWRRIIRIHGGVNVYGGEEAKFYTYPNGFRMYVAGMDRPGAALSSERDFIFINQLEELHVQDYEYLTTRCTGRGAVTQTPMIFADCNPGPPTHWILSRPSLVKLKSRHEDNPTLFDAVGQITAQGKRTMEILNALTGVRKERLRFGRWVAAEGAVYNFDRTLHVITREQFKKIQMRRWVCSVDFGYTNPFVWQRWGLDGDGNMYLEREIYRTKRTVRAHAEEINRLNRGFSIDATVCDHDSEDRATLEENGIATIAAYKAVRRGIENVETRMACIEQPAIGDPNTLVLRPRIYIVEDSCESRDEDLALAKKPLCTADEFTGYRYKITTDGRTLKEEPVKEDDHGMDPMRYAAAYIDSLHIEGSGDFRAETGDSAVFASDDDEEEHGPGDPVGEDGDREF